MISDFIQKLRKEKGLSHKFMASKLNISRPTYVQIEEGKRDLTITEAKNLSNLFGLTLDDFLQEKETNVIVTIEEDKNTIEDSKNEIRISVPQQKKDKFKQILLYILKKVGGKPNIGMTALYKLLYFIDFDYYEKYEDQLMGLVYLKNHHGPTPLLFENLIEDLIKEGQIEKLKSKFYEYPQTKYLINPTIEPDLSILNGQEQEHIDNELERLSNMTASELTELSHKDVPWISAKNGKQLDYESVFYRTAETSVRNYGTNPND